MERIVQKYGGSSVSTTEKIEAIAENIIATKGENTQMLVVVSAMGDTTDDYIGLAKKLSDDPDKRELDVLMSTGEMISASLLAISLNEQGQKAVSYNAYQLDIRTNGIHGKSQIKDIDVSKIEKKLEDGSIVIVTGFQGIDEIGDITTLGRGGSDTSAVALAVKLDARCEIYTDVDGIYSVDPRKYSDAHKLDEIEYEEMLELASSGAQVMHSRSIELAQKYGIELYVGRTLGKEKGTYIRGNSKMNIEGKVITGIATSDEDSAITLKEFKAENISGLFEDISVKGINVDMISQTAPIDGVVNVSFTIPKDEVRLIKGIIDKYIEAKNVVVDDEITKFSLVGLGMRDTYGVASKVFKIFNENDIALKMITTSEIRITCAINSKDKMTAIQKVAKEFDL
ncbi:MAG: aspartate kinase [Clostridioides sp.]|jgi:aspartate kinase|nr:aspartate kinase [Clostridioides sp.]